MVLAKNLQLALFHVTWSSLCMYTQNNKNQLATRCHLAQASSLSGTKEPKELFLSRRNRLCSSSVSSGLLFISLFPLVTVRCTAL